jgi:dTDP-glucose 4,6-dehydratase
MLFVTGGAGLIGSRFVLGWIAQNHELAVNMDSLRYAGDLQNSPSSQADETHGSFKCDTTDLPPFEHLSVATWASVILNFASESYVGRPMNEQRDVTQTDIVGLVRVLEKVCAFFFESFSQLGFDNTALLDFCSVQDNHSRSVRGALRHL